MAAAMNATYASPTADAAFAKVSVSSENLISTLLSRVNGWSLAITILLSLVAYDQSVSSRSSCFQAHELTAC